MKRRLIIVAILLCVTGCVTKNMAKKSASMDMVESAIRAQIKSDLIEKGKYKETDFTDRNLPGYDVFRLKDADFDPPYADELDGLDDAVVATSLLNSDADLIIALRANNERAADAAVARLGEIHEEQLERLKEYLPDQADKVEDFILKKADNYVIYIVYGNSRKMEEVIIGVIR